MFRRFLFITPFFFTFFFISSPAFAVNDYTVTYTESSSFTNVDLCGGSSSISCDSYNYLIVSFNGDRLVSSKLRQIRFYLYPDSDYTAYTFPPTYSIIDVSSLVRVRFTPVASQFDSASSFTLTITLSSSMPDSDCPVCPLIPENPYDNKFDDVVTAIYTCGAIMLVLYFFYSIYRVIIKTTGGF